MELLSKLNSNLEGQAAELRALKDRIGNSPTRTLPGSG
ncbi:hypothetical protein SBV1_3630008 [Verrucomicrobia bacterium]|nr:hypothetical protein SBV1_3630008 [Verrucomicrobiota bacterium]